MRTIGKQFLSIVKSGLLFKILYLILALLSFNSLFSNRPVLTYFSYFLTLIGCIYLGFRVFHFNRYRSTKGIIFLLLFILSYVISSVLNIKYGITENAKAMIWMLFQFFLLYAYDAGVSKEQTKKEFKIFSHVFLTYTFLMAIIGTILLFMNYRYYGIYNGKTIIIGFLWNRLWGLYSDPNYGAVFGVISFILCFYYLFRAQKKWQKALYVMMAVFQVAYIAFSDSRTALVAFMLTSGVGAFLFFLRYEKQKHQKRIVRACLTVLLTIVAFLLPYAVIQTTAYAGSYLLKAIQSNYSSEKPGTVEDDESLTIGRQEADMNNDISNRRFAIWESALEVSSTKPIFGVTFRQIVPYAKENLPDTYIVSNDYTSFASMHNVFMDVLVSQGAVGLLLFFGFILSILITIFKNLFRKDDREYTANLFLICTILPIAISAMFYSEILYINTANAVFFWFGLGCLVKNLTHKDDSQSEVGILTFHNATNYGACLQAFALQTKLTEMGHPADIVDYRPAAVEDDFGIIIKNQLREACKSPVAFVKFWISTLLHLPWRVLRENKFLRFKQMNYALSDETYADIAELRAGANQLPYSYYFFGSDQIWNPNLTNGVDPAYFGGFCPDETVKSSYAASTGSRLPSAEEKAEIQEQLKNMTNISVREAASAEWLSEITDKPISVCVDPTLLLAPETWEKYCKKTNVHGDYILVYVLEINPELSALVASVAQEKNLPVVFFDIKNRYSCKAISKNTADPFEFISYLKDAKYVITNSFHGTVFSVLFRKQFLCLPNQKNPTRMVELLQKLGLGERLIASADEKTVLDRVIDFEVAFQKLDELKADSQKYLDSVFSSRGE